MKFSIITLSIFTISLGYYGINAEDSPPSLRGSDEQTRRALRVQRPCTLVLVETEYKDELGDNDGRERLYNRSRNRGGNRRKLKKDDDQVVRCELQGEDREAVGKYFVPVNGIETSELENIVSGDTTLMATDATIMDGEMWLPAGASIELGSNGENDRRRRLQTLRQEGIKKVLVVRADAKGSSTTASAATLSDKIFGTRGDTNTLKSQYMDCSHGKLELQPYVGMTEGGTFVRDGVLDVSLDLNVPGSVRYTVEDAMEEAATKLVGSLSKQFDHVMLCVPPGSSDGNWVAYGYINSWLSVYNDDLCKSMSIQVHEIGHNLGLAHSGKDDISYGDRSGMMGYSYNRDNGPMQCFNPAKTYQLGWFDDKTVVVNPNDGTWVGTIIGAVDYSNASVDSNANVILKIITGESKDLYVGYNRQKDMNSGVVSAGDMVTIVEQESGYSKSNFLASLSEGSTHTFSNFGGSDKNLVVKFIERGSTFDEVKIAIYFDYCEFPSCCLGPMCADLLQAPDLFVNIPVQLLSSTPAPTAKPSVAPTTLEPTVAPTTLEPTYFPTTADPTFEPTVSTTTLEPTVAPTTSKPTFRPTSQRPLRERWTRKPTPAPTTKSASTTNKPTLAPTQKPIYSISYNGGQPNVRKHLLTETFRNDLGFFYNSGEVEVTQELFSWVLTAKFPLESPSVRPALSTMLALQGTSTVDVSFWYSAEKMEVNEGFKLQFSTDFGTSWTDVMSYVFGEGGFVTTNKWNLAQQATFEVHSGTDTVMIRIIGETNLGLSDSVFHVAGINIYGK